MKQSNPHIIPRNLLVEEALTKATSDDYDLFYELLHKLRHPYDYSIFHSKRFIESGKTDEEYVTFCGT